MNLIGTGAEEVGHLTKKNGELEPRILRSFIVPGISTYTRHYSNAIVGRFSRDTNALCKRMNKSISGFFYKLLLFLKENMHVLDCVYSTIATTKIR